MPKTFVMSDISHAIIIVGKAPVRADSSDRSEMVSQMLLGETADIIRQHDHKKWVYLRSRIDGYEGWMNQNEVRLINENQLEDWEEDPQRDRWPYASLRMFNEQGQAQKVPFGAFIKWDKDQQQCSCFNEMYYWKDSSPLFRLKQEHPLLTALALRGTPYLWGARSDEELDCSGFMQLVIQVHGISCLRDARQQVEMGEHVAGLETAQPGDWVFFDVHGTGISHVGWYLGDQLLLHASGKVRIQRIARSKKKRFNDLFDLNKTLADSVADIRRIAVKSTINSSKLNKIDLSELLLGTQ